MDTAIQDRRKQEIEEIKGWNMHVVADLLGLRKDEQRKDMYFYPTETNASIHISFENGKWLFYDFGRKAGGSNIDLVMHIQKVGYKEALNLLRMWRQIVIERQQEQPAQPETTVLDTAVVNTASNLIQNTAETPPVVKPEKPAVEKQKTELIEVNYLPFVPLSLENYLVERKVLAKDVWSCGGVFVELIFKKADKIWKKQGIGLRIRNGKGLVVRTPEHKLNLGRTGVFWKRAYTSSLHVYEGMFDMFSGRHLNLFDPVKADLLCLNSVNNLSEKIIEEIKGYKKIFLCLDNDPAGKVATQRLVFSLLQESLNREVYVANFVGKDINEALIKSQKVVFAKMSIGQAVTPAREETK